MLQCVTPMFLAAVLVQGGDPVPSPTTSGPPTEAIQEFLDGCAAHGLRAVVRVDATDAEVFEYAVGSADVTSGRANERITRMDFGSLSAVFTACAILQLEADEKLSTTDTLQTFFPDAPQDMAEITLLDLLQHTAGLRAGLVGSRAATRAEFVKGVFGHQLAHEVGLDYHFSLEGYGLLAAVIEVAAGESFESYVQEHVFAPAGMSAVRFADDVDEAAAIGHEFERSVARTPNQWGTKGIGGVWGTVADLHAFATWAFAGGLPQMIQQELTAARDAEGRGFSVTTRGTRKAGRTFECRGNAAGFESFVSFSEASGTTLAVLINERSVWNGLPDRLSAALTGEALTTPTRVVRMAPEELAGYAAHYQLPGRGRIDLWLEHGRLLMGPVGQAASNLLLYRSPTGMPADETVAVLTDELLTALAADDRNALDVLLHEKDLTEQIDAFWADEWLARLGEFGAIEAVEVQSAGTLRERSRVVARIAYESGEAFLHVVWRDSKVVEIGFGDPHPVAHHVVPVGADEFQLYDTDPARAMRILFYRGPEGELLGVRVLTPTHAVRCSRATSGG